MATQVKRHCREHGGYFISPAKRGRPPVRCAEDYACDKAQSNGHAPIQRLKGERPSEAAMWIASEELPNKITMRVNTKKLNEAVQRQERKRNAAEVAQVTAERHPEAVSKPRSPKNASLPKAQQAKRQLEALGWECKGTASVETGPEGQRWQVATIIASRGVELLTLTWRDGFLFSNDYSLWDVEHPAANGKPNSNLPFDPDEIPDKELVQRLAGTRVRWYNRLGAKEEFGYVSPQHIEIVHSYNGHGDETPGMRIVRFAEAEGHGFRAFRLDALLKVG
jgi:hypothetical protein